VKLKKLVNDEQIANPYELTAIKPDCLLVSLIRKYHCPDGVYKDVFYIPAAKIARKINSSQSNVRYRWHQDILPQVERRVAIKLQDDEIMSAFLVLQAHKACQGKLVDCEGIQVHTAYDWESLDFKHISPFWPYCISENKLRATLTSHPKFHVSPLPDVIRSVRKELLTKFTRSEINEAVIAHTDEFDRILNLIANRGDVYLKQDSLNDEENTAQPTEEFMLSD
jgi:hypothetical protein